MKCIYCGKGEGIETRNGFFYICTLCVNDLLEFADLGKDFFREFIAKGSISSEFIESKIKNLKEFQEKWKVVDDFITKIRP